MEFGTIFIIVVASVGVGGLFLAIAEQNKVNAMTPDERQNYVFGAVNVHLVCPHCQTTGKVRGKNVTRQIVSTGTIGGILKTNTKSTTAKVVTQHHCDQCVSTWDI